MVINRFEDGFVAMNLLNKSAFALDASLFEVLDALHTHEEPAELAAALPSYDADSLAAALDLLADLGALIPVGSPADVADMALGQRWHWGAPALGLHLATRDMEFASLEESAASQGARMLVEPSPPLRQGLRQDSAIIELPDAIEGNDLVSLMARRRTIRQAIDVPLNLQVVADALFAGVGIVGETRNVTGTLPLKTTPSGGARNPYEAWLIARNVTGLNPGVYHYCGLAHALEPVEAPVLPPLGGLIAGQGWADDMAAMVILVAHFERTMWKYRDSNAYKVVLIEAGHIGQNIALAATRHGLTACPTAALAHSRIEALLGICDPLITPVYALALGVPGTDPDVTLYTTAGRRPSVES
jgi:SagB-type dehydrogenase family enzyme